jgi:polar amino acid transport system ATP-binding protein
MSLVDKTLAKASLVDIVDVRKSFGPVEVLKGVSVAVERGDVVAIIGRSGSGKSTLLRCINGLETYDSGAIVVDGIDVGLSAREGKLRELRRNVGMVFQQFNLFPHLTAAENVMLAPTVVNKVQPGEAKELAAEMLAKVGLSDKANNYPSQLSGGQQQRVAIARALAMRPNVLLCDEITSALDPELVNEVLRVVEGLAREGITLVLVTHEMRFARDVGTKLVFMHMGKVHEEGPPKELFANPRTPELQNFVGSVH